MTDHIVTSDDKFSKLNPLHPPRHVAAPDDVNPPAELDCAAQVMAFIGTLFQPDDWVNIRNMYRHDVNAYPRNRGTLAKHFEREIAGLQKLNGANWEIYVGINPRKSLKQLTRDKNVALARCVFIDIDDADATLDSALTRLDKYTIPRPSMIVESGHGYHFYWLLTEPITDLDFFTKVQQDLAAALDGDPSICNPERVMRLAGFLNTKNLSAIVPLSPHRIRTRTHL